MWKWKEIQELLWKKRIISILSDVAKNTAVRKAILAHHNCTLEMARNMFE